MLSNSSSFSGSEVVCPQPVDDPNASLKIFNFVLIISVSAVGLIGNLLSILTFQRMDRKTSATAFLKALSAFDILLIIATNLFAHRYAYTLVFPHGWVNYFAAGSFTIGVLPFSYICQSLSTWTIVAVTFDRYIHICHSTKAPKWCKIEIANRVVIGIVISSLVYNIPRFFEYYKIWQNAKEVVNPCTGYFEMPANTLGANHVYKYSYAFGLYMATMYVLPLGALAVFNGKLIFKLKSMNNIEGLENTADQVRVADKILPSLIVIVILFFISQIPDMVLQILWRVNSPFAPTFSIIAYDSILINSSMNFIVYVIAADGFRRSLVKHVLKFLASPQVSSQ